MTYLESSYAIVIISRHELRNEALQKHDKKCDVVGNIQGGWASYIKPKILMVL